MYGKKARNPAKAVRTVVERRYISLKPGDFHMHCLPGGLLRALSKSSCCHILDREREKKKGRTQSPKWHFYAYMECPRKDLSFANINYSFQGNHGAANGSLCRRPGPAAVPPKSKYPFPAPRIHVHYSRRSSFPIVDSAHDRCRGRCGR